jgi:hypothetical protein
MSTCTHKRQSYRCRKAKPQSHGHLTVKLRGREPALDHSRGRTLASRARGETTASHGTLQRLLGATGFGMASLGFGESIEA